MLNAIRFLERVGREQMSEDDYRSAVCSLDVNDAQRMALTACDQAALVTLLRAPTSMFFGVFAPEEQPDEEVPNRDLPEEPAQQPDSDA